MVPVTGPNQQQPKQARWGAEAGTTRPAGRGSETRHDEARTGETPEDDLGSGYTP